MNLIMDLLSNLSTNINPDKVPGALLELGILLAFFVLLIWWSRSTEKKAKARALEKYKNYTGRAEGRILEHHWVHVSSGRRDPETGKDDVDSYFIITYEFEADGQTYRGKGEASASFMGRKTQTICYDPSDPNQNCSLYYLNSQTKSASCLRVLIYMLVRFAILLGVIYLILKISGKI
ncbi:MAG: hypothetical protein J5636_07225 [Clostridiales bacterium]|nr:hypothetical protein [Clostridiales bacterium]